MDNETQDGVDVTLIQWMLSMTPQERLETLPSVVDSILELRGESIAEVGNAAALEDN